MDVDYPSRAAVGSTLVVVVTVNWSRSSSSWNYLAIVLGDVEKDDTVSSIPTGAPTPCMTLTTGQGTEGVCVFKLPGSRGTENVRFSLVAPYNPRAWRLRAIAAFVDYNLNIVSSSLISRDFSIEITDHVFLSVNVPSGARVTLDGVEHPPGAIRLDVRIGPHALSVPTTIAVSSDTRLRFDHWSDSSSMPNRTIYLSSDTQLEAIYTRQYLLAVTRISGETSSEWYDRGTVATVSVPSMIEPMKGILGVIGGKMIFEGWYEKGALLSTATEISITMDKPHVVEARWKQDYTAPSLFIGGILLGTISVLIIAQRMGRTRGQKCPRCGSAYLAESDYCIECGTKRASLWKRMKSGNATDK